jgi:hypothetical protein
VRGRGRRSGGGGGIWGWGEMGYDRGMSGAAAIPVGVSGPVDSRGGMIPRVRQPLMSTNLLRGGIT